MRTIGHAVTSLFVAVMMSGALFTVPATGQAADTRDLILAAYSVPKEAYERHIIPAFQKHWKQKTGHAAKPSCPLQQAMGEVRDAIANILDHYTLSRFAHNNLVEGS